MYAFQPRVPLDHVLKAVRLVRSEDFSWPELLKLLGASFGEVGALMAEGVVFPAELPDMDIDEAISKLEDLENSVQNENDPNFDPGIWIPVILLVLEWLMKRRQG